MKGKKQLFRGSLVARKTPEKKVHWWRRGSLHEKKFVGERIFRATTASLREGEVQKGGEKIEG